MDLNALTDDEWDDLFGDDPDSAPNDGPRRFPLWAKVATGLAVVAMLLSAVPGAVTFVRQLDDVDQPEQIRAEAQDFAADARWGWLVSRVLISDLEPANVGARVRTNPGDGIVEIDNRSWDLSDLDETMAHEIGHLLDFALYANPSALEPGRQVRGGLEQEVWAECAAVFVGERSLDGEGAEQEYRCRPSELAVFEAEIALVDMVCRPWDEPECR